MRLNITSAALALAFLAAYPVGSAQAADHPCPPGGNCLMSGGEAGDYWKHYGPPVVSVLGKIAWDDVVLATSNGTPDNMRSVMENPGNYGLGQANVVAALIDTDPYKGKVKIVRTQPIGQEFVFLVVTPQLFERAQSYATIANNADRVRFALPSETSGPGMTYNQLVKLDPRLLKAQGVQRVGSVDDALKLVASGQASATLVVQAANPDNDRFKFIKANKLRVIPVRIPQMLEVKLPDGQPAFVPCGNQDVGVEKQPLEGACTPILLLANTANTNSKLADMASVPSEQFAPREGAFAKYWKQGMTYAKTARSAAESWVKEQM